MAPTPSDSRAEEFEIIRKVLKGDQSAYAVLVGKYKERAIRVAHGFMNNYEDAADAAQEAFIKAYKNLGRFQYKSGFYTWFYRILLNCCKDMVKKRKPTVSVEDNLGLVDAKLQPTGADEKERLMQSDFLSRFLDKLSFKQRSVIVLSYFEGMTIEAVSKIMNVSEGTVKATKFQALKKLRQLINESSEVSYGKT